MCVCVCVCFWIYECFASKVWGVLESLIWCLDVWLNSLIIAFISMCFSLLEKPHFFKLDTSSTDIISIERSSYDLDRSSTVSISIEIFGFDLDSFLIDRSIRQAKILCSLSARHVLNRFSIHRGWLLLDRSLIASRSIRTLLHALFFTCLASFFYLVIHSFLFHSIHAFLWIPFVPLIIFMFLGWSFIASCTLCQLWQKDGENVVFF